MKKSYEYLCLGFLFFFGWWMFPLLSDQRVTSKQNPSSFVQTELYFSDCHDGDTCTVKTKEGIQMTLRLMGIDAPEVAKNRGPKKNRHAGQIFGKEAKYYLLQKVNGNTLPVKLFGADTYHRYLAIIFEKEKDGTLKNKSLNEELVEEGYSFAYRSPSAKRGQTFAWAVDAEKRAQKNKKGFWALAEPPENPSEFRKKNR